jgi:hypothetical protein
VAQPDGKQARAGAKRFFSQVITQWQRRKRGRFRVAIGLLRLCSFWQKIYLPADWRNPAPERTHERPVVFSFE